LDDASVELVARWREKRDQQAADELFRRYVYRLTGLARSRLSAKLAQRFDPEDLVQSVFRCFFTGVSKGRFKLKQGVKLWGLLASLTWRMVLRKVEKHSAKMRSYHREENAAGEEDLFGVPNDALAREPTPTEEALLADELERVKQEFEPVHQEIIDLCLLGRNNAEIAADTARSEATVRRVVAKFEKQLARALGEKAEL
jgi:RNA polymerase sigma-70 factor (ECF subfamily)